MEFFHVDVTGEETTVPLRLVMTVEGLASCHETMVKILPKIEETGG